jgi:hypothetical protein
LSYRWPGPCEEQPFYTYNLPAKTNCRLFPLLIGIANDYRNYRAAIDARIAMWQPGVASGDR